MTEDDRDFSRAANASQAPEDMVWGHFGRCWRGECSLLITFLTGTGVWAVVTAFFFWLEQRAGEGHWSADVRFFVFGSKLSVMGLVSGWLAVGLLRSSLRNYLLGRRFWPIVAGIYGAALAIVTVWTVVYVGPQIVSAAISRLIGVYP
jgi:hypothetical protein